MDRSGTQVMGVVTFTYDDQGRPVFDEPMFAEVVEEMLEANVPQIFALSYQYVKAMTN
jgi:dTDP-glucose pyrophosphorylase